MTLGEDNELKELAALRLRSAAEDQLAASPTAQDPERASAEVLQELRVHQIELEMQNDALRQAKLDLEVSRDRYLHLYEFAPAGYLTLTPEGFISQVNLTGSALFGRQRTQLLRRNFSAFVVEADQMRWKSQWPGILSGGGAASLELALHRGDRAPIAVQLVCQREDGASPSAVAAAEVRMVLTDISERKQTESDLRESQTQLRQLTHHLQQLREADRAHVARELHDELGQSLMALRIDVDLLAQDLESGEPGLGARLGAIDRTLHATVEAVRCICEDLRPGVLDDLGLEAALAFLVKRFVAQSGVRCDLELSHEDFGLGEPVSTAIFRIVQESLTNIARHAQASHAMVALQDKGDHVLLSIADDGCGLPGVRLGEGGAGVRRRNFGLLGLRERVNMLGGRLAIDSEAGRGTHIEVLVPTLPPFAAQESNA